MFQTTNQSGFKAFESFVDEPPPKTCHGYQMVSNGPGTLATFKALHHSRIDACVAVRPMRTKPPMPLTLVSITHVVWMVWMVCFGFATSTLQSAPDKCLEYLKS